MRGVPTTRTVRSATGLPSVRDALAGTRATAAAVFLLSALLPLQLAAQVEGRPVHEGSGPVSELSTNVRTGSRPVHERGRSVHSGNPPRLSGNSVRASSTGTAGTGPVSEISAGPVTQRRPLRGRRTVTDVSVGAVKLERGAPLGAPIADPLSDLGPLQERLRAVQPLPRDAAVPASD